MSALLAVAKRYVITDSGWNLLDFATQMRSLTGGNLVFRTLPIQGYGTWGSPAQDVNIIDPARIKAIVHAAFYPPRGPSTGHRHGHQHARPVPKATVTIFNGTQTPLLAAHVSAALAKAGYPTGKPGNIRPQSATIVRYGAGASASASAIAKLFGVTAVASSAVKPGHVEVLLGQGATVPNVRPASSPSPSPPASVIPGMGPQGGAVLVGKQGIPCVD